MSPNGAGRLRVLHVIGFLRAYGGAERFVLGLATHLPRDRFESWICAPRGAEEEPSRVLAEAGIPLVVLGRRAKWDVHRMSGLATLIGAERFDIVHTHLFSSNLWGTLVGRARRVPVVIAHEHTWSYQGNPLRAWLDGRVIGRLATRFIAVSAADAERMVRIERVPSEKVVVMPTAYVPSHESPFGDLRAELDLSPESMLVGTAASLRPQKALHVLVEAHARVVSALPNTHLVVAGGGECRPELERRVRELGLEGSTHFLGARNDVDAILRSLDVAVMSSDFEGTPLFAHECMATSTPLVATAVGGLRDVIDDGETGLLVPPRQPERLAEAIISLLVDPDRRARIGAAAARRAEGFRIETIAERFASLYESLLQEATADGRDQLAFSP